MRNREVYLQQNLPCRELMQRTVRQATLHMGVANGYYLRKLTKAMKRPKESTALSKVLATYCLFHRQQLVLMLKFLREEKKKCSHVCHGHLHILKQAKSCKREEKSSAIYYTSTKEKLRNCLRLKKQMSSANLPYLSVRLKDLRLTWPNLTPGTVKLNPIKHEDFHLPSNDPTLHCINTRSKKKTFLMNSSSRYRAISCSSSLPRLKLQRISTSLDGTIVKSNLKYQDGPVSSISIKTNYCQTESAYKTVSKSSIKKDLPCDIEGEQNKVMQREDNASSQDKQKLDSVHFGNLIKHLLNSSKTNNFVELLNQDANNLKDTQIRTRFHRSQKKSPTPGCSSSRNQSLECTSKPNSCDAFPRKNNRNGEDSRNSMANVAVGSIKINICDNIVKSSQNTECAAQKSKTELPHSKSRVHSKNVNCVKNSQPCLPKGSNFPTTEDVKHKRQLNLDSFVECRIPLKRYSKNILGKCKLCDVSHGQCSVQMTSNLFCKCTIKRNSGIFKKMTTNALVGRNTTDQARNTHLKVVVERLKNTICPGAQISKIEHCATSKSMTVQSKRLGLSLGQLSTNPQTSSRTSLPLLSTSATQKNQGGSKSVSNNSATCPIKQMFVSKIESEDGVKYSLSPVYRPIHNIRDHQSLSKLTNDAEKNNAMPAYPGESFSSNKVLNPQCKLISSSPLEACATTQNHPEDAYTMRRKRSVRVRQHTLCNKRKSKSNNLNNARPIKTKNNLNNSNHATRSITHSKIVHNLRQSRTTDTYIAKNISSTQIKIKKLHNILETPETSDLSNDGLSGDLTTPLERDNCKISIGVSTCHQNPENPSTVRGLHVVNECRSVQTKPKKKNKSCLDDQLEVNKKVDNLEKCEAEQNLNQKAKFRRRKIVKSHLTSSYMTRSKKSPLFSLYYGSQTKFSVRCALLHKSKKHSLGKMKHYRTKPRSNEQLYKVPFVLLNRIDSEDHSPCSSAGSDLQTNTPIEWWSTTTSNETLLNHLESGYEHIAKTWVTENNVENNSETQSSPVWKFSSLESRSPIQMLFQKKCDTNDLATWFMQTTETQSLTILRKENARKPRRKNTEKGPRRTKQLDIHSTVSKKYLKKRSHLQQSDTSEELYRVSRFVSPDSFSLTISKHKPQNNLQMNSLKSSSDKTKEVCVKFSCAGENLDVTEFCTTKLINSAEAPEEKTLQSTKDSLNVSSGFGRERGSSPHVELRAQISSKQHMKALRENRPRRSTRCRNNKMSIKDCKVLLSKCGSKETKMLRSAENGKCTVKSDSGLRAKYGLQVVKTFSKRQRLKKMCRYEMCLRKLRGTVVNCDSHCNTPGLEERNKNMKVALYIKKTKNRPKGQRSANRKVQSDSTKLHMGPLKPVGFPATRGLINKYGGYSLTPIRISSKQ